MAKGRDWPKVLTDASNRGLTVRALARELGVHNKVVYDCEKTYGIRLPRRDETREATMVEPYVADGTEQWRPVPGYERYEASSLGRIRSLITGKLLSLSVHADRGYRIAVLWREDGTKQSSWAHRWTALTFLSNPDGLPQVNHKDRVRTNNVVENLEWSSRADNYQHGIAGERLLSRSNAKVQRKLTPAAVADIMSQKPDYPRKRVNHHISTRLAVQYGVGKRYIMRIWAGEKRRYDTSPIGAKDNG